MTAQASTAMQQNADMVMHAVIWHYIVPIAIIAVALGILRIAFEIVKTIVRRQFRKYYPKQPKRWR